MKFFHYKSAGYAKRTLARLQAIYPDNAFELRLRGDWRFYIWATLPNGKGGWVQKVTHSQIGERLPKPA